MSLNRYNNLTFHRTSALGSLSADQINQVNERQLSLLQIAAREGQLHHVLTLLKQGADVNQTRNSESDSEYIRNNAKKSPLYFALEREHHFIAAILFITGADRDAAMKTACLLNDVKVQQQLQHLTVDRSILKALLAWAIKEKITAATPLFQNLMATVTTTLQLSREVRLSITNEEKKSDVPEEIENPFIENPFTEKDVASFIEFSAYLDAKDFIDALSSYGVAHRYDPTLHNAAYWFALNNNAVIQGASANDVGLMLSQLFQEGHTDLFAKLLKQASPQSRDHFKLVDNRLESLEARKASSLVLRTLELSMSDKDWVNLSLNAHENIVFPQHAHLPASPALKAFALIYNGENMYENLLTLKNTDYRMEIAQAFPGLFNYVIAKQINVYRAYQICPLEKAMIMHCRLTEQQRENFIDSSIQDRHAGIDPAMRSSLFATYFSALSIPHQIIQPRDRFVSLGDDPTHLIINYLNADDHHRLEQSNRLFRRLVQANEYRQTRLVLRAKGREYAASVSLRQQEFAEYENLCRQIALMMKFLEDEQKEFDSVGFLKRNKVRIIGALSTLIVISMTGVSSYFFHELDGEKESIKETMRHVNYNYNSLNSTCIDFVSYARGFGCNGYMPCKPVNNACVISADLPNNIDILCQPYCNELQSLYPAWGASFAGSVIPVSLLFIYWMISYLKDCCCFESKYVDGCDDFKTRWNRATLSTHSEALQNTAAELSSITTDIELRNRGWKKLGSYKSVLNDRLSFFNERKALLEASLGINRHPVAPVVNEEKAAEPELQPHIAGLDEGLDAPLLQHPGL